MKLQRVIINNFRNIHHAEYDLRDLNIFTGPNAKGKTNTILAIYWALADYLMDGSSDYPSFKPHSDTAAEVSVELTFDTFKLRKTYQEHWKKTRGSNEVILTGHDTTYFIDDVKYAVTEAIKLLSEKLGVADVKVTNKIDIIRAIIDPYYLGMQVPWKDLRAFIIDLIGDVDDETVLNMNDAYSIIRDDLGRYKYDVTTLTKLYRQNIKQSADEIEKQHNILAGYNDINDVDPDDLQKANAELKSIDKAITDLKVQQRSTINPRVAELEKEHAELQVAYVDSANDDRKVLVGMNAKVNADIYKKSVEYDDNKTALRELNKKAQEQAKIRDDITYQLEKKQRERKDKAEQKDALGSEWEQLEAIEYQNNMSVQKCPNCGFILNQVDLDQAKEAWKADKQKRLDEIVSKGKKLAGEIDNLSFEIVELEKKKNDLPGEDFQASIDKLDAANEKLDQEIHELRGQLKIDYMSEKTAELVNKGKAVKEELEKEKQVKTGADIEQRITELEQSKNPYEAVIADHNAYLAVQRTAAETKKRIKTLQEAQVTAESKLMTLEDFIKTKLTLLKQNVSKVFGKLEFILVESNIKEGSYNEVCYPLILGKKTPFATGSGAEKIITGVYIIECVKRCLELQNLPIIFDEADKLDTQTIATKLTTGSQIISTKVDDINYQKVTLVSK